MIKWLKYNKQFIIATVIFSIFGTGVAFGLPYIPSDAMLDPTCAPGDANCYVSIVPTLTSGSVAFSDGSTLTQDNTNFTFNDATNQLYSKYAKTDSIEFPNSSFAKVYNALPANTYGSVVSMGKNLFSGAALQTGTSNPTGADNLPGGVIIGENILSSFTGMWGVSRSVFIGNSIFTSSSYDPTYNVAVGSSIGGTGDQNQGVFIGSEVLASSSATGGYTSSNGHKNVAIGRQAMFKSNSGLNTAVGALALSRLTTGSNNVAIGAGSGNGVTNSVASDLTGSSNTFLGSNTTWSVDAISNATAVGYGVSLSQSNTVILGSSADVGVGTSTPTFKLHVVGGDASFNTVRVGLGAGSVATNTAVGYQTLNSNSIGSQNTAVGYQTLYSSVSALQNTAIGYTALYTNTGNGSTAVGYRTLYSNIGGVDNTAVGKQSLENNNSGVSNTAVGVYSLRTNTTSSGNTAVGVNALYSNSTTGYNTAVGVNALYYNTGLYNTGIGGNVMYNTTGNYNIGMGLNALRSNTGGSNNVSLGYDSGYNSGGTGNLDNNIFIGYQAANNATSGAGNNVIIGYDIDLPTSNGDNQLSIGNLIFGTAIDGTGTTLSTGNIGIGDSTPAAKFTVGDGDLFQVNSSGAIAAATGVTSSGTITFSSISGSTQCLQANSSGVISGTGSSCGGGGAAISALTAAAATNTINNADYAQVWQWNTLSSNSGLTLSSTSTAAASNTQKVLNISTSGANATSTQTTYGAYISNTHTGTSSTNIGLYVESSGGTNNYAAKFDGNTNIVGDIFIRDTNLIRYASINEGIAIGKNTGSITGMAQSIVIGNTAVQGAGAGAYSDYSVIIGDSAAYNLESGDMNVIIGASAMPNLAASAGGNVSIGAQTGGSATTTGESLFLGQGAGSTITGGYNLIAIGAYSKVSATNRANIGDINGSGYEINLGIGLQNASARLQLPAGTATASSAPLKFTSGTNLTTAEAGVVEYDGTQLFFSPANSDRNILLQNSTATAFTTGSIPFATTNGFIAEDNSNFFWDDTNDRLGIGDATPDYGLDVVADINTDDCFREAGAQVAGTCTSDERLKHNITSLTGSLEKVMQLRPVSFEWNEDIESLGGTLRYVSGRQVGLIAQEMAQVFPDLVKEKNGYYAVSYNLELQMIALNAIQELDLKLTDLSSLDLAKENSLANKIKIFLADVGNGIDVIYSKLVNTDKVQTKELCVGSVCVNEDQFLQMVNQSGITPNPTPTPTPTPIPDPDPNPTPDPTPDTIPTPEPDLIPIPEPDPIPNPEPAPEPVI